MLYNDYKNVCLEEAKKAVSEYNDTIEAINEMQKELNMVRRRSSDLISSVESYINTIANVPKELSKDFEEIRIECQEYEKEVSRLEERAYLSDDVEKVIAGASLLGFLFPLVNGIRGKKGDDEKNDFNLVLLFIWLIFQCLFCLVFLFINKYLGDKARAYAQKIRTENKANLDLLEELGNLIEETETQYEGVSIKLDALKVQNITNYKKAGYQTRQDLGALVQDTCTLSKTLVKKVKDE